MVDNLFMLSFYVPCAMVIESPELIVQAFSKELNHCKLQFSIRVPSIDFKVLNFAEKKTGRRLPAGPVPVADPFSEGEIPEVEITFEDTSKFGEATMLKLEASREDNSDLYKQAKVTTWEVFRRSGNISKVVQWRVVDRNLSRQGAYVGSANLIILVSAHHFKFYFFAFVSEV
ncbi:hypothetical protein Dsin_010824 [Dipteronia sinensis]|uniref:Uncharacterized protein n=1 Tax=Dipteronia sinensis TaxID=43782 RepID=A0AAE0AUJ8_9ROSI|nr:hypothetical protein Dsin_010824 [Dipteronia sinensis]